ncbi:hypothetical protein OHA71_21375 [Streptomyces sp. NBC_00444]|uniref:hypothetical protein n=1 Tax=Streptomyces sp. NBC_00444 TaxID=2975744 RepID=UPI002E1B9BE2
MRKGLVVTLLWLVAGVTAWQLLQEPGTQLEGRVLLAVVIGVAAALLIPGMFFSVNGEVIELRGAPRLVLFHAAALLIVATLAFMGYLERGEGEYIWKYGEPRTISVPKRWTCKMGAGECHGSWEALGSDDRTQQGTVHIWRDDFDRYGLRGPLPAGEEDDTAEFEGRALGDEAATSGYADQHREAVVLGRIPAVVGWVAGGLGLILAFYSTAPGRTPRR